MLRVCLHVCKKNEKEADKLQSCAWYFFFFAVLKIFPFLPRATFMLPFISTPGKVIYFLWNFSFESCLLRK